VRVQTELEAALEDWTDDATVGALFLQYAPYFKVSQSLPGGRWQGERLGSLTAVNRAVGETRVAHCSQ
jgi:hypothetical protein